MKIDGKSYWISRVQARSSLYVHTIDLPAWKCMPREVFFRMIKGFDKLSYDQEAATGRRLLALESRMTRRDGAMASCIALLSSADGFAWSLVDGAFLAPKKKKHVHSFDTVIPSFDPAPGKA